MRTIDYSPKKQKNYSTGAISLRFLSTIFPDFINATIALGPKKITLHYLSVTLSLSVLSRGASPSNYFGFCPSYSLHLSIVLSIPSFISLSLYLPRSHRKVFPDSEKTLCNVRENVT